MVPVVIAWVRDGRAPVERAAGKLHHSVERIAPDLERARSLAEPMLEQALGRLSARA
jgi:hypothetical protein